MRRTKGAKPSPALIVAVVALVAALAGTAIGGVAVTSLSKKDKKQVTKIAKKQAKKLDKKIELTPGPKGAKGEPGEPATRLFARVGSDGTLKSGSAGASAEKLVGSGDYQVSWGQQELTECAVTATRETGANGQGVIRRSVSPTAINKVRIITQTLNATKADQGFAVAVFC